ncbi:tail fiber assembly protein [Morganella morganii subsp. morganii]|uniref:tail fiber assembly protein n=1 Tax=Morganella morganii TaxID=582 RepID=UPI001BD9C80E|nr:tail fiber assembly protein [Morganella morganii]MBT0503167.1 tail fiber assembly protein [Morganella morganii subsp. morganii]QWM15839.1 tail fiber assembly protein [Morganella morganii subsp. morganii]
MADYSTEIQYAVFDENGLATVPGWAKIYRAHPLTREYTGTAMDYVPFGFSVVGDAYTDEPELPAPGFAIVRSEDGKRWLHVEDHRGKTAYDKTTKEKVLINTVGTLPDNLTLLEPQTPFDKWDGEKWVTDKAEQHAHEVAVAESKKQSLLAEAEQEIAMLERKIRLNMATETDQAKLTEWEIYSVKLTDTDTSAGAGTEWPTPPVSPAR